MSYAFAPARCVASKNGDFRYQGPRTGCSGLRCTACHLLGRIGPTTRIVYLRDSSRRESARRETDSEQTHLMLQRLAQAILQSPRVESELPAGLRVVPQVGHARDISEPLGARQGGDGPEETGRRVEPGRGDTRVRIVQRD